MNVPTPESPFMPFLKTNAAPKLCQCYVVYATTSPTHATYAPNKHVGI